jgi:UrcA family protein
MLTSVVRRPAPAITILCLVVSMGLTAAPPAAAAPKGTWRTHAVRYDDLDLTLQGGVRRLERRIATAVRIVCGPAPATTASAKARLECLAASAANAQAKVEQAVEARRPLVAAQR